MRFQTGMHLLDGATGTNLMADGMPQGACMAQWVLEHPGPLTALQRAYAQAGSEIVYAPTFQAQPMALAAFRLEKQMETYNEALIALSRKAAPGCLIAGNLTTLRGCIGTSDEANFERIAEDYRRQIHALVSGGAALLGGCCGTTPAYIQALSLELQ